jgi:penicillin amidase
LYPLQASPAAVERLLREKPPGWFADYDKLLLDTLADALDEGRRMQGRNLARWDYGRFNRMIVNNPVAGRLPLVGKYFNIGEVAMGGSTESPLQKPPDAAFGPSMRMVVDLADFDRSMQNITMGQSGQILSRHYRDQWEAYYAGRSFPMQFNKVEAKSTLVFLPETR